MDSYCLYEQPVLEDKSKLTADPALKNKLKLDFSQLGISKFKPPADFIIHKQPTVQYTTNPNPNPKEAGTTKLKVPLPGLDLEGIKDK